MRVKIAGTGSSVPALSVSNDDLSKIMDTSDEWIRTRTGIEKRCLAVEETTTSMAVCASRKAMQMANLPGEEVDLVIAATISGDHIIPGLACEVQAELGLDHALAFDISAACSGFVFGLGIAKAYLETGVYKNALVIGAETLSKLMDWSDRSTCVLFGDGAGAAILKAEEGDATEGILSIVQGSDGKRGDALLCKNRIPNHPFHPQEEAMQYVHMDGQAVYKFAVKTVPKAIQEALEKAGVSTDDIDCYVLHQANRRIIESVAKRLKQPLDKFPMNMNRYGNISAASVPILLDEINRCGNLAKGAKIVLAGFGAGLTWGAVVLTW